MNSNDCWQEFISCGSISSYLKYIKQIKKETDVKNEGKSVYDQRINHS